MKNKKGKLFIGIISLIVFFSLLELGLRFAGHFYLQRRIGARPLGISSTIGQECKGGGYVFDQADYTILAVGDSYTYGGLYDLEKTYPYILEEKTLKKGLNKKYRVINAGICEYNSRQVLIRLPEWIKKYDPDMILLLVGATDKFNFAGYSISEMGLKGLLSDLKIFKMAKITFFNIRAKLAQKKGKSFLQVLTEGRNDPYLGVDGFSLGTREHRAFYYIRRMAKIDSLPLQPSGLEQAWYHYNNGERKKAIKVCKQALEENPFSLELLVNMAFFHYIVDYYECLDDSACAEQVPLDNWLKARYYLNRAYEIAPESEFVLDGLSHFYVWAYEDYLHRGKYNLAVSALKKAIEIDPRDHHLYYMLAQTYGFQSMHDADLIINLFQKILKGNPDLKKNELFMKYLAFFQNKEKWERSVNQHIKNNLEKIVKLCQRHDIELIIQNYPYFYTAANNILRNIALQSGLSFVDHQAVFNQKIEEKSLEYYLKGDEHCTLEGYQLMARNIYHLLEEKGFLD